MKFTKESKVPESLESSAAAHVAAVFGKTKTPAPDREDSETDLVHKIRGSKQQVAQARQVERLFSPDSSVQNTNDEPAHDSPYPNQPLQLAGGGTGKKGQKRKLETSSNKKPEKEEITWDQASTVSESEEQTVETGEAEEEESDLQWPGSFNVDGKKYVCLDKGSTGLVYEKSPKPEKRGDDRHVTIHDPKGSFDAWLKDPKYHVKVHQSRNKYVVIEFSGDKELSIDNGNASDSPEHISEKTALKEARDIKKSFWNSIPAGAKSPVAESTSKPVKKRKVKKIKKNFAATVNEKRGHNKKFIKKKR